MQELALVDHPTGLLPWELLFCQTYASTGQFVESMRCVISTHELDEANEHSLRMRAVSLLKRPDVAAYVRHLLKRVESLGVATRLEATMWLSDAFRTPIGMIDEMDPLCQRKTTTITRKPDGSETERTVLEMVSKIEAVKMLAKLNGWDAPIKVDVNHGGGVMRVPMSATLEDWERVAADSQERLMNDSVIDI